MTITAPAARRVTPTARLILPASADRADWLAARRLGIGSSDVADLLEVGYKTPSHVYYDKRGMPLEDEAGEPALWGNLHEETVAREWARRNRSVVRRVGLVAHDEQPWMMCTLDRRVTECPLNRDQHEQCALEVKTRNAWVASKWRRAVPDDVLAQTLWQIRVTGYDHIHVAVLIGGSDYRQSVVRRKGNEQLIADIATVAGQMWQRIKDGTPPPPSGNPDRLVELWDQLNPTREGVADLDATDAHEQLLAYESGRLREKAGKAEKDAAKANLVALLGGAEMGAFGNDYAYGYKANSRQSVDMNRLAEEFPDAYEACVRETTSRRLDIAKDYRLTEAL
ncbi:lambda-exonuclease family protein [Streptosporangium sp. NPDC002544]|uniref:YqaJ viral recombinase family nuclease n=1 Tax=Streptosporangium sp. NPDC002544 TaxID=3154538 RepID=UPI00333128CC